MDDADREVDELAALTGALQGALEALALIGRRLNPPDLPALLDAIGAPEAALSEHLQRASGWQGPVAALRAPLEEAGQAVMSAFEGLRAGVAEGDVTQSFKALRQGPRALDRCGGCIGRIQADRLCGRARAACSRRIRPEILAGFHP